MQISSQSLAIGDLAIDKMNPMLLFCLKHFPKRFFFTLTETFY